MSHRARPAIPSRMNLSSIPFTSPLGKLLRLPLRIVPKGAVLAVLRGELRGTKWIVGFSTHGFWLGYYEHENQGLFASLHFCPRVRHFNVRAYFWVRQVPSALFR